MFLKMRILRLGLLPMTSKGNAPVSIKRLEVVFGVDNLRTSVLGNYEYLHS